jgi:hypothetical protein
MRFNIYVSNEGKYIVEYSFNDVEGGTGMEIVGAVGDVQAMVGKLLLEHFDRIQFYNDRSRQDCGRG